MILKVNYRDSEGIIHNQTYSISLLELIKHLGLAGMKYRTTLSAFFSGCGFLLYHREFWMLPGFANATCFRVPQDEIYNVTKKGQFSNNIGVALADFLARKLYGADFTQNYDAVLRLYNREMPEQRIPLNISRPDLYCINTVDCKQFAMEAKGSSDLTCSSERMEEVIRQANETHLNEAFSVASVTFSVFDEITTNFYDPPNPDAEYNDNLNKRIIKEYYSGFYRLIQAYPARSIDPRFRGNTHDFYLIYLPPYPPFDFDYPRSFNRNRYGLLIAKETLNSGRFGNFARFKSIKEKDIFVDVDGIGIIDLRR